MDNVQSCEHISAFRRVPRRYVGYTQNHVNEYLHIINSGVRQKIGQKAQLSSKITPIIIGEEHYKRAPFPVGNV